ncbi:NUDIX hydrolase, partial [Streptomyces milbemycinicus]
SASSMSCTIYVVCDMGKVIILMRGVVGGGCDHRAMRDDTSTTAYWDAAAGHFDDEPDHGLRDPAVREACLAPARRHAEIVDVHLILRRGDEVLLARRANTGYADGLLHAPSGHVEDGEDVRAALLRETAEEIGITLSPDEVRAVLVMQHKAPTGAARTGWFFEAELGEPGRPGEDGREPVNREPEKCSELGWFPLDALPDDMVAYCRAGLDAYRAGHRFTLHWHEPGDPIAYDPAGPDRLTPLG